MSSVSSSSDYVRPAPPELPRLCIHTATNRPLPLEVAVDEYAGAGVSGITVWRDALAGRDPKDAGDRIRSAGLRVVSLCRGGFFVSPTLEGRQAAIEENRTVIREAAAIGAPLIVLVCGAAPSVPLPEARDQIRAGIEAVLPLAQELGVHLAIEPLHPMFADTRSAITSMESANDLAEAIDSPYVGVAVDVYHLWFDPNLEREIARAGAAKKAAARGGVFAPGSASTAAGGGVAAANRASAATGAVASPVAVTPDAAAGPASIPGAAGNIFAFHVCDWRSPTRDLLNDRGLMGEGCIDIPRIRSWVERAGFAGAIEVEIFSNELWATDQRQYIGRIVDAYQASV